MSQPINIAIRADAGSNVGLGHFARMASVADALLEIGNTNVILVTSAAGAKLAPSYFSPHVKILSSSQVSHSVAKSLSELAEVYELPDAICLDEYGKVAEWERESRLKGIPLLALDDLNEATTATLIVRLHDQTAPSESGTVLRGPRYLPLSRYITEAKADQRQAKGQNLQLNICFGGSDPTGETTKAILAVKDIPDLDVDVIIGPDTSIPSDLDETIHHNPHVTLYRKPTQKALSQLMANADFALGAGGVMLWERMFLGLPSLVIAAADNQVPQISSMVEANAIRYIGEHSTVTPDLIATAVLELASDKPAREALSASGKQLIDGLGASRLAAWLCAMTFGTRQVTLEDAESLLAWRSHESNWKYNWSEASKPTMAEHKAWLDAKIADPACMFSIIENRDEPIGVVRFDIDEEKSAYLSIYLVPDSHGKRLGLPVLFAAEKLLRHSHPSVVRIHSRIHKDNLASERLHRIAGFEIVASTEQNGWLNAFKFLS